LPVIFIEFFYNRTFEDKWHWFLQAGCHLCDIQEVTRSWWLPIS